MKVLLALVLLGSHAFAYTTRLRGLRVNADGSRIYFLSDMRLAGSSQPFHGKIFSATAAGVETVFEIPLPQPLTLNSTPFYIDSLDVSTSGEVLAYTARLECEQSLPCSVDLKREGVVVTAQGRVLWRGQAQTLRISPDGRYAVAAQPAGVFRIHLATGAKDLLAPGGGMTSLAIGSNGAVALPSGFRLTYTSPTDYRVLPSGNIQSWQLSGDGNHIAYVKSGGGVSVVQDIRTGAETEFPGEAVALSSDAGHILYRAYPSQASEFEYFLFDRVSGETCSVYRDQPFSISEAALSADGQVVHIATEFGIHRTGCGQPLTPVFWLPASYVPQSTVTVPGSLLPIYVDNIFSPIERKAASPLPQELAGYRVRLGDRLLPIEDLRVAGVDRKRVEVRAQVPWDFSWPQTDVPISVETPQRSPFESKFSSPATIRVQPYQPLFLQTPEFAIEALHADTERPVTRTDPARPLETVHVFLTGLGKVDREVSTGMPAPGNPPAKPLTATFCDTYDSSRVILAPGRIGVYFWTIVMPATSPVASVHLRCGEASGVVPFLNQPQ